MPVVRVFVTLKPSLLDAEGRVVQRALQHLGYRSVEGVRMGKYIELEVADDEKDIGGRVKEMCDRLLANPVIENYRYEVEA